MGKAFAAGRRQHQMRTSCILYQDMESTTLSDRSNSGHSDPTLNGVARSSGSADKGTYSAIFDGTNDYYQFADSSDWDLGTEPFTITVAVRADAWDGTSGEWLIGEGDGADATGPRLTGWALSITGYGPDEIKLYNYDGVVFTNLAVTWTPSTATWYTIGVTRNGADVKFFLDGAQQGATQTISAALAFDRETSIGVISGKWGANAGSYFYYDGYIDEVQVIKGVDASFGSALPVQATAFAI